MSAFNGSGTFVISGTGLPYVTNTTISSTVGNQLNTDLATGLSTAITKDGQTTITANIPMSGFKLTGLGVASTSGDALSYGQPIVASTIVGTSLSLSGAISAAFGTTGVKLNSAAFTQTDSTTAAGTVGSAYGSELGATTFATASNTITITNGYGVYFKAPVAGSNVTLTNGYALGADSANIVGTAVAQVFAASGASLNPLTVNSTASAGPVVTFFRSSVLRGQIGNWNGVIGSGSTTDFALNATTGSLGLAGSGNVGITISSAGIPTLVTPVLGTPTSGTLTNCTGYPVANIANLGTGVATALAINTGTDGAFVVKAGALGTPSSGTLTSCTGLPIAGISGLGTGVATLLAGTPSGTTGLAGKASPTFSGTVTGPDAATWASTGLLGLAALRAGTTTGQFNAGEIFTVVSASTTVPAACFKGGGTGSPGPVVAIMGTDASAGHMMDFYSTQTSAVVGSISYTTSAVAFNTSSDARLKQNISDAEDAGAIIDALRVRQWDWRTTGEHQPFGFVAQEEAAVYAHAVTAGDDGDEIEKTWGRDDSKLVPLLVKEIQALRKRLAAANI